MEEDRKSHELMYIKSLSGDTFGNGTHVFTLHMVDFHVTVLCTDAPIRGGWDA